LYECPPLQLLSSKNANQSANNKIEQFHNGICNMEKSAAQAQANPKVGMIGCEPFINGVAALLDRISTDNLLNIRIFDDDARKLLDCLPPESLARAYVLFSDPWPKARHHKRRFMGPAALDAFSRLLKDNAEVRFASDHMGYVRWVLEQMTHHPDFVWPARAPADWRDRPGDWVETRYEKKALESGRKCVYLTFRRRSRG